MSLTMSVADNVVGPGDGFDNAYFEINYVKAYTTGAVPTALAAQATPGTSSSSATTTRQMHLGFGLLIGLVILPITLVLSRLAF
jgi:hypothetical protein